MCNKKSKHKSLFVFNLSIRWQDFKYVMILGDASEYVEKLDFNTYKCGLCAKTFSVKSNCTRHVKINHLGEVRDEDTKQPCVYCGKHLVKRTIPQHVLKSCPKAPGYQNPVTYESF